MPLPPLGDRQPYYTTEAGAAYLGDSVELMKELDDHSVDLICTSPPFALLRQKGYGNVVSKQYVDWFRPFAEQFKRILKPEGSLVIDLGGTWLKGLPYRSLYHYEFLLELCRPIEEGGQFGFFLAQELYWYNPAKLPTPAEWVTIRRVRVKDAVNTVWWLRPTAVNDKKDGKVSNRRVLKAYSAAQENLMQNGYTPKLRPSEHDISDQFGNDNGGAIPPNILQDTESIYEVGGPVPVNVVSASNTSSNDRYQRLSRESGAKRHPARFPKALPEFIIGLTTEEGDLVLDPFAGSNTTGEVAQEMGRRYLAFELDGDYLDASRFRFEELGGEPKQKAVKVVREPAQSSLFTVEVVSKDDVDTKNMEAV
jgi:DNA modification methylase